MSDAAHTTTTSSGDTNNSTSDAETYARLLPQLSRTAAQCVQLMAKWPTGEEHDFHRAFRGFTAFTRAQQKQHTELMQLISTCYRDEAANPVEAVDALFENVDHLLDSVRGVRVGADRQEEIRLGITGTHDNNKSNSANARGGNNTQNQQQQQQQQQVQSSLTRPQDHFAVPPDNFSEHFRRFVADPAAIDGEHPHRRYTGNDNDDTKHPLGDGTMHNFQWQPQQTVPPAKEQVFLPLETTPCEFIDTPQQLAAAVAGPLSDPTVTEIAVDVEHHSDHSYLGFVCLVQLSTRTHDFVIDTIALHDEMWRLAPIFHDPKIVKVLHSAQEDVRWLQRDFGLFLVNMFDTAIALQTLRMPFSLAFLVDHLCQVKLNKQYQNSDWRARPLPPSQLKYAQQDTHYLLYCYDRLRAMLAAADTRASGTNLLMHVLDDSKRLAATLYRKPAFNEETTWREMLGRSIAGLFPHQLAAIRGIFNWREKRARTVDTSPNAVLSNGQLLSIGCRLPSTAAEVLRMANPATVEVRRGVKELLAIIEQARASAVDAAMTQTQTQQQQSQQKKSNTGKKSAVTTTTGDGATAAASEATSAQHVHIPMTGTLPSVSGQTVNLLLHQKPPTAGSDNSSNKDSLPAWMSCFQQLPKSDLASIVPVPMPAGWTSSRRRGREEKEEEQEQAADDEQQKPEGAAKDEQSGDDQDDDDVNVRQQNGGDDNGPAVPPNSAAATANSNKSKNAAEKGVIKSLAEEHGGLGRKTRKNTRK